MFEKEDKFVVKAELPGIKEEDIDVSVIGDTLEDLSLGGAGCPFLLNGQDRGLVESEPKVKLTVS